MADANISAETADPALFNKWERFEEQNKCSNPVDCAAISVSPGDESQGAKAALPNGNTPTTIESPRSSVTGAKNSTENTPVGRENGHATDICDKNESSEPGETWSVGSNSGSSVTDRRSQSSNISGLGGPKDQNTNDSSKKDEERKITVESRTKGAEINGDSGIETDLIAVTRASINQTVTTPKNSKFSHLDKSRDNSQITAVSSPEDAGNKNWITFEENSSPNDAKTNLVVGGKARGSVATSWSQTEGKPSVVEPNMALSQTNNISTCDKNALVEDMFSPAIDTVTTPSSLSESSEVTSKDEAKKQPSKASKFDKKTAVLQNESATTTKNREVTSNVSTKEAFSSSKTAIETTNNTVKNTTTSSPKSWVNFDDEKSSLLALSLTNENNKEGSFAGNVSSVSTSNEHVSAKTPEVSKNKQSLPSTTSSSGHIKSELSESKEPISQSVSNSDNANINKSSTSGNETQKQWVTFDESLTTVKSSKDGHSQTSVVSTTTTTTTTTSASAEVAANSPKDTSSASDAISAQPSVTTASSSWVTFSEDTNQKQVLPNLSVVIPTQNSIDQKEPSTPSPNPFLNAPKGAIPNQGMGANPFKVPAEIPLSVVTSTNPFKPSGELGNAAQVDQFPAGVTAAKPSCGLSSADLDVLEGISSAPPLVKSITTPTPLTKTPPTRPITATEKPSNEKPVGLVREEKMQVEKIVLENDLPMDDFPAKSAANSWTLLLRYPDKKKKIGSRNWKPVVLKLEGSTLQFYEEYELSAPFREIPLQACFAFSEPVLQANHNHKVHTVKLEYVKYKESRKVRKGGDIEHIVISNPIIKVGSPNHLVMKHFMEAVGESLRTLPAYRDRGITYSRDEVFIDIDDTCYVLSDGNGAVLKQAAKVQIKLRAFLTGDPECQLVLNDIVVKEREEARLRGELKPQRVHHWVKLCNIKFHKCVNASSFAESHSIMFHPLDACTFELMHFRVPQTKQLPLQVKASLNVHNEQRVELKAEIQVCQDAKLAKYERNNVVFRFPIPDSWVPLFRRSKPFGGEKSIKSTKGRRAMGIKGRLKNSKCWIAASLGTAKYEPEYAAIMWRIDKLPLIQSKIPVDAPQTLTCRLELPAGMEYPEHYEPYAELSYDIAYVLVSDTTVIAVKVSNQNIPEKWVCYRSFYHYHIQMGVSRPSSGPVRDVGCSQQ